MIRKTLFLALVTTINICTASQNNCNAHWAQQDLRFIRDTGL